jgi:hypothetical protein
MFYLQQGVVGVQLPQLPSGFCLDSQAALLSQSGARNISLPPLLHVGLIIQAEVAVGAAKGLL